MEIPPLAEVRRLTEKKRDAWWTVFLVDPVATPLVRWTAMRTRITPNQITWAALVLGLGAAACFAMGDWKWLVVGAVVYHCSFILDCMDGKLARLTGKGSEFGGWLDYIFDRIRVLACAVALMGGQFHRTGDAVYMWLAVAVVFLDALRYLDALQIFKVRHGMRTKLERRQGELNSRGGLKFMEDLLREEELAAAEAAENVPARQAAPAAPAAVTEPLTANAAAAPEAAAAPVVDLQQSFKSRFGPYAAFRAFLIRHRVRPHLVSGIEFQMAVFIIAPLTGFIVGTTVVAAVLLLLFELAIIYKLLLSTRDFERVMARMEQEAGPRAEAPAQNGDTSPLQASVS
ncbi:CDP-alcohol phosphatidyltransferase family protein [Streptomyces sp. NPDC002574]|uniref:CDP-alcohol phosphatidyltransferase family protein n=1 Tax=Streptomyces sp. NPDC002574 TaxID=3364652 RepID=UPI0036CCB072